MRIRPGSPVAVAVVVLLVIVGLGVTAFSPCAVMGMACDSPCPAPTSPLLRVQAGVLLPVGAIAGAAVQDPAVPSLKVPQPPPKSLFSAAA